MTPSLSMDNRAFQTLTNYLLKIPAVSVLSTGNHENGLWWVKLRIDIDNKLAWQVVQELACVINYLSLNERLPASFYPVSPAPYLNGGPDEFLSWIIETQNPDFKPGTLMKWLEGRLPRPVDDVTQWIIEQ